MDCDTIMPIMKKNVSLLREDWNCLRATWQPEAGRTQTEAFKQLADIINGLTDADLLDSLLFQSHTLEMPAELVAALENGRQRFAAEVHRQGITTRQQTSEKALLLLAARMLTQPVGPAAKPPARAADNSATHFVEERNRSLEVFEL